MRQENVFERARRAAAVIAACVICLPTTQAGAQEPSLGRNVAALDLQAETTADLQEPALDGDVTLEQILRFAAEHSPHLASARAVAASRETEVRAAEQLRLPTLDFSSTGVHSQFQDRRLIPGARLGTGRADGLSLDQIFNNQIAAVEGGLNLPLYTGGEIGAQEDRARAEYGVAAAETLLTRDQLLSTVTLRYLNLLEADEEIRVTRASYRALAQTATFLEKKADVGKALPVDVLRIRTRLADLEVADLRAQSTYITQLNDLSALAGIDIAEGVRPQDSLIFRPVSFDEAQLPDFVSSNPDVIRRRWHVEAAQSQRRFLKALRIPHLGLSVNSGWYWGDKAAGAPAFGENSVDLFLKLRVTLPILNFPLDSRTTAAAIRVDAAQNALEQARRNIEADIRSAFLDLKVAEAAMEAAQRSVRTAEEAFRIQGRSYEAGKAAIDDLLNAEAALLGARLNHMRVRIGYYRAATALYGLRGGVTIDELSFFTSLR